MSHDLSSRHVSNFSCGSLERFAYCTVYRFYVFIFFYLFIFFIYESTNLFDFALSYCTLFARKKTSYIVVLRCCATAVHKTFITVIGN